MPDTTSDAGHSALACVARERRCHRWRITPSDLAWKPSTHPSGRICLSNALTAIEREAIGLCVCCDALSNLVNHSLLQFTAVEDHADEMEVRFHTGVHQNLFLIRLLDFANESGAIAPLGGKASCLGVLKQAAARRRLSPGTACEALSAAVTALTDWLEATITPQLWLPTIQLDTHLPLTRYQLLWLSGNQARHNPARLTAASKDVHAWLSRQGHPVPAECSAFLLRDFRAHVNEGFFVYYATQLAELLNDIRWGIQSYLAPVLVRTYRSDDSHPLGYRFEAPHRIRAESAAHRWFQSLMGHVRAGPSVPPFRASKFLQVMNSMEW